MKVQPMLCTRCWGAAEPFFEDGMLNGWLCECGHFEKAVGRERLFREQDDDPEED